MKTYKLSPQASAEFDAFRDWLWAQSPLRWRFNARPTASVSLEVLLWLKDQLVEKLEASDIPWSEFEAKTRRGRPQAHYKRDNRPSSTAYKPNDIRKLSRVDPPDPSTKLSE